MSDAGASSPPPTRHRADDDVEALADGSFGAVARTPNGDADLLSGEAASVLALASESDGNNDDTNSDNGNNGAFSIDDGIEDEDELPSSDPLAAATATTRGRDPDGGGNPKPYVKKASVESVDSASDRAAVDDASIDPKIGTKVTKLSHKTTKIMSDYQAYLAEIETEFPSEEAEPGAADPALASVNGMRDTVRETFQLGGAAEKGEGSGGLVPIQEDGYITGGGTLARDWYYGRDDLNPPLAGTNLAAVDRVGGYDDFDEEEHRQLVRGQKYTHEWLQNRRVLRGLLGFVVLSVIVGLSIGVATNKRQNLPDWEGEMGAEGGETSSSSTSGGGPPWDEEKTSQKQHQHQHQLYEDAVTRYRPLELDRSKGWLGRTYDEAVAFCGERPGYVMCPYAAVCPAGEDSEPLGGYRETPGGGWSWIPVLDSPNEWVEVGSANGCIQYSHMHKDPPEWGVSGEDNEENTRNIMCCLLDGLRNHDLLYESVEQKFRPLSFDRSSGWVGKSYPEAVEFCDAVEDGSYGLCPYSVVCPLGLDSEPLGAARGDGPEAWLPVLDEMNEWVQVGRGDPCIEYSHEHPGGPGWGMSGKGGEGVTQNLACCLRREETSGVADAMRYELVVSRYHPQYYDRSEGWEGRTFEEALDFCDGIEGYELCSYDAVCPLGPDREPLSSYAEETSWVPIIDRANEWVNIGRDDACIEYSHMNSEAPEWGMNGIGNEGITPGVMCCAHPGTAIDPIATPHPNQITETPEVPVAEILTIPVHSEEDTQMYAGTIARYHPMWYNRRQGWKGQTYLQALQFCSTRNEGTYELCPLDAICPLGQDTEPLGGYRDEPAGTWVPILNDANEWVQVSSMGDQGGACIRYDHEHSDPTPKWGLTGEGDEEMTRHLACCMVQPGELVEEVTYGDVETPATTRATATTKTTAATPATKVVLASEDEEQYLIMAEKYLPEWHNRDKGWDGSTYLQAVQFCKDSKEGYGLCPIQAVCPLGPESEPLGGYDMVDPGGSWVPIVNTPNDWVQVGKTDGGGTCIRYSSEQPTPPEWGLTGEDAEDITRRLICCMDLGTEYAGMDQETSDLEQAATTTANDEGGASEQQMYQKVYQTISETYQPKFFDRSQGWRGQTYSEAFAFCADFDFYMPCPYEAICPLGQGGEPLGGHKNSNPNGASFAPILDRPNAWVQLNEDAPCIQWSHMHPGPPPWGETGEDNEELTRNVACCLDVSVTPEPTLNPTDAPTDRPTSKPTDAPTPQPTKEPTLPPTVPPTTAQPTKMPTETPTPKPTRTPTLKPTAKPTLSDTEYYKAIVERLEPIWFDRANGWEGQTYLEALNFCATQESRIPCPYIAYCPVGTKKHPLGGFKEGVSWAPVIDAPNAWVQVGEESMCELYSELFQSPPEWGLTGKNDEDLTRHVMCCLEEALDEALEPASYVPGVEMSFTETEQAVLDVFKAQWYGRGEGYQGTTYAESEEFCNNIGGMDLCPLEAYCPNGPANDHASKPLFLQLPAFEGEQWAPVKTLDDDEDDSYVLIGTINNNPVTTCLSYRHFHNGEMPLWGLDGSNPELKLNILCCKNPGYISTGIINPAVDLTIGLPELSDQEPGVFDVESAIIKDLDPEWLSFSDGWIGGSHENAEEFCESRGGKQICPYAAYCPHGPGQPVSKGHSTDISAEGAQWAPVFGHENHWVMVGQKHGNIATTCFGHEDLEGGPPDWGLTADQHEIKKFIMCCRVT